MAITDDRYAREPFGEALTYLRDKISLDTDSWRDISGDEHDAFFVVAGAKGSLLSELRTAVDSAIERGVRPEDFQATFEKIAEGWDYRGDAGWRSRIILQTNLRAAYGRGREELQLDPEVLRLQPYLQYIHGGSGSPRPHHLALNGQVFTAGTLPWPCPAGYNCSCRYVSLSSRRLSELGLSPSTLKRGDSVDVLMPDGRTVRTTLRPDEGWDRQPGQARDARRQELIQRVIDRSPPAIARQIRAATAGYKPPAQPVTVVAPAPAPTPTATPTGEVEPTLKGDPSWNPNAKTDLTPGEFRRYVDDQYWLKNQADPTAAHNLSWDEYKAANPLARKGDYQYQVKEAIRSNQFVPSKSALAGLKLNKAELALLENNRAGIEQRNARIADMDRAVNAPLMPDSTRGWKPQMTPAEAAEYLDGSYFGNTRFYHGNRATITDDIANDGAKPWLNDKGIYGQGTYFGVDPKIGDLYAKVSSQNGNVKVGIVTSHIKARNPYVVTSAQLDELGASFPGSQSNGTDSATMTAFLKARGYDSLYLTDLGYGVAFDQRQVVVVSNERLTRERLDGIVIDPSVSAKDMVSPDNESAATLRRTTSKPIQGDPPDEEWMGLGELSTYNPGSGDDWDDY